MKITGKQILSGMTAILAMLSTSCSNFLEEHAQNASYIDTPSDMEELLYGSCFRATTAPTAMCLHLMSDETEEWYVNKTTGAAMGNTSYLMMVAGLYRWHPDPFTTYTKTAKSSYVTEEWDDFYKSISIANSLMMSAEKFSTSDPQVAYVLGSAHYMRAWYYFLLVNLYGEPYNKANPEACEGVPYKSDPAIESTKFKRNTTGYVYGRIVEDLAEAARLLEQSKKYAKSKFKVSPNACYALQSRVYLYMERYAEAIAAADKIENAPLFDLVAGYIPGGGEVFLQERNSEVIFAQGGPTITSLMPGSGARVFNQSTGVYSISVSATAYRVSDELAALFDNNDMRSTAFFALSYDVQGLVCRKHRVQLSEGLYETDPVTREELPFNPQTGQQFNECASLRYGEVVLNKAEAQACSGDAGAAQTIRDFVATRYIVPPAVPTVKDDLIRFIRNERRKELCMEGHRWFDLRRYAVNTVLPQTKQIVHKYYTTVSNVTAFRGEYTLMPYSEQTKGSWILPINAGTLDFCYPNLTNFDREAGITLTVY